MRGPLPRKREECDAPEAVETPDWLSPEAREIFDSLVEDLTAARVPIKAVDSHAIAMAAHCVQQTQEWASIQTQAADVGSRKECAALVVRFQRDAQDWLSVIGGTPKSRAQMGIKGATQKTPAGALAVLRARQQERASA